MEGLEARVAMKVHVVSGQVVLAVCDPPLLGKVLSTGDLDVTVSQGFYEGDLVDIETFLKIASQCTCINAIGQVCVSALISSGMIESESVVYLQGVPHSQVYVV